MTPKLNWRRIGGVNIFELEGIFSESWLTRGKQEMTTVLNRCPSTGLLFNLRSLERVDHPGAEWILDTTRKAPKGGILGQNLASFFVAEYLRPSEPLPIFETQREAIEYFGKEFAQNGEGSSSGEDKRLFPRIKTALPVELSCKEAGSAFRFEAAVLNLSEGGFYGRFLDSKTEGLATQALDPFDLKLLTVRLSLPGWQGVKTDGKVLRTRREQAGDGVMAVEFYNLNSTDRQKIQNFLDKASVK